jgi:hypothetical protein
MSDTSIRLSEEAKARLDLQKRPDESYNDVILRLTRNDKWAGFGVATGDPARARGGMAEIRERLRDDLTEDIEEPGS